MSGVSTFSTFMAGPAVPVEEMHRQLEAARNDTRQLYRKVAWASWYDGAFCRQLIQTRDEMRLQGITVRRAPFCCSANKTKILDVEGGGGTKHVFHLVHEYCK